MEFDSADLAASGAAVTIAISENRLIAPLEAYAPTRHNDTWRLESNKDLYEGVRYAFINITAAGGRSRAGVARGRRGSSTEQGFTAWHITGLRRVCQVVPTNYAGSFHSSDSNLDRIWWTGAYTVKVNVACSL